MNGIKHGKAKEYYDNGKLKFEGIIINNILIGILYDKNGNIKLQSYEENGKIKEYSSEDNRLIFEGEWIFKC